MRAQNTYYIYTYTREKKKKKKKKKTNSESGETAFFDEKHPEN